MTAEQQFAEQLGVTYQQTHKYETGANRIAVGRLQHMAWVLGVDVGYFYSGPGSGTVGSWSNEGRPAPTA